MVNLEENFINEFKKLNINKERKKFLRKLADEAMINELSEYALFFSGYMILVQKPSDFYLKSRNSPQRS